MAGAARALQPAAERFLSLAEQLDSPAVLIDLAPGVSTYARLEILDAPNGPSAADVVRKTARALNVFPGALDAEFDAVFPGDPDPEAFHLMIGGRRVGLVYGMDLDAFIDAVIAVGAANLKTRKS